MAEIIEFIKKLKTKELALVISIIISCVYTAFWIENRYAKLIDTQAEIKAQQDKLNIQQAIIDQAQDQILTIIHALPKEQKEDILSKLRASKEIKATMGNKLL